MDVSLSPTLETKLSRMASEAGRGAAELVRDLVENYVEHDEWFRREVKVGLAQIESGDLLDYAQVGVLLKSLIFQHAND